MKDVDGQMRRQKDSVSRGFEAPFVSFDWLHRPVIVTKQCPRSEKLEGKAAVDS